MSAENQDPPAVDEQRRPRSADSASGTILERVGRLEGRPPVSTRYELRDEVGRGGMGSILRVWDRDLGRVLAMKVALKRVDTRELESGSISTAQSSAKVLGRFLEEAQITSQLDHPGVVPVHELGLDEQGCVYFTMRYVEGFELGGLLDSVCNERPAPDGELWPLARAVGVLLRVCEAVAYAHDKGVIHRDLKPANIMVGRFGQVYVMDWGLARVLGADDKHEVVIDRRSSEKPVQTDRRQHADTSELSPLVTLDGEVVGTPAYMSPEQAHGELASMGPPADVYALGAILYQLLAGFAPYNNPGRERNALVVWRAVTEGPPTALEQLAPLAPPDLIAICEKAMARKATDRYADMAELGEDLRAWMEGRVVRAYETGALAEFRKWIRRNKALAGTAAAALLSTIGGLGATAWISLEAADRAEQQNKALIASEEVATEARDEANRAAHEAEIALGDSERASYVASVNAAATSIAEGSAGVARRRLEACPEHLRGWEWHHLDLRRDTSMLTLGGHTEPVDSMAFLPDGRHVASAGEDGTIRVFNVRTGELSTTLDCGLPVSDLCLNPDGSQVAVYDNSGKIHVWDIEREERVALLDHEARIERQNGHDFVLGGFADDGATFISFKRDGTALRWSLDTGKLLPGLEPMTDVFSGDMFSVMTITNAAMAPNGDLAAFARIEGIIQIVHLETDRVVQTLRAGEHLPRTLCFDSHSRLLALGDVEGHVRVVRIEDRAVMLDIEVGDRMVRGLAFSPDGGRLYAVSSGRIRVWDISTGREMGVVGSLETTLKAMALSPDGGRLVTGETSQGGMRVWSTRAASATTTLSEPTSAVRMLGFLEGGSLLAYAQSSEKELRLIDAKSGDPKGAIAGSNVGVLLSAVSPDGRYIATATTRDTIYLWSSRGEKLASFDAHGRRVRALAFDPGGRVLASGSSDGTLRLWNVEGRRPIGVPVSGSLQISALAFYPGSSMIAWGDHQGGVHLMTLDGTEVLRFQGPQLSVSSLSFRPDGAWLAAACGDTFVRIYDIQTGTVVSVLEGHEDSVTQVLFSHDGRRLFSAARDRTVCVWDPDASMLLSSLRGHTDSIGSMVESPTGTRLVTGGADGQILIYESDWGEAQDMWRGALLRDLARPLLGELFLDLFTVERVEQGLETLNLPQMFGPGIGQAFTNTVSGPLISCALGVARSAGDNPPRILTEAAWPLVVSEASSPEQFRRARRALEAAEKDAPLKIRGYVRCALGLAHIRCGEFEPGVELLTRNRRRITGTYPNEYLPPRFEMQAIVDLGIAIALLEQGQLEGAREKFAQIVEPVDANAPGAFPSLYSEVARRLQPR